MTKGIRAATIAAFIATLPQRAELGNTGFRKTVMSKIMTDHGITLASAATHYNHALKLQRETAPETVLDLGRPEDKKGGRKPKVVATTDAVAAETPAAPVVQLVNVVKVKDGSVVAVGLTVEAANELIEKAAAAKKSKLAIAEAPVETATAVETPAETPALEAPVETAPAAEAPAQETAAA
jgi:hypothetical protein